MGRSRRAVLAGLASVAGGCVASGSRGREAARSGPPSALVAGSLLGVAGRVPGASVEAHGSAAVRRLVLRGAREPDAVALADPRLFAGVSERAALFATNALVLAYDPDSPRAGLLTHDWRTALADERVTVGRTNPDTDPLGYRTVMALRLADVDAAAVRERSPVFAETTLLSAVAGGPVDAAFAYRNMAVEADLPYVTLPDRLDFSTPAAAETYASVSYDLPERTVHGTPIRYGAAAVTPAGRDWVDRLVTGTERLRTAGFGVPKAYPRREVAVGGHEDTEG